MSPLAAMPFVTFPDPEDASPEGVVAWGGDLHPDTLLAAYRQGIFPWPHRGMPLLWFSPPQRAVLEFDRLHIPERLARLRRNTTLTFTIDAAFPSVIAACQSIPRSDQDGTWITPAMKTSYCRLHTLGAAHSVEAWNAEGEMVGGLYGVDSGGAFSGESMFHTAANASRLALLHLIDHLSARGLDFIDIQQLTPHMAALGAREIHRADFLERWREQIACGLKLFDSL